MNGKTLEEVKQHCLDNGYNLKARTQICAFLVGAKVKDENCTIKFKVGNGNFSDFIKWFNNPKQELEHERGKFVSSKGDDFATIVLDVFEDLCRKLHLHSKR